MKAGNKNQFTLDEMLSHLVDAEWDDRHNRKLARLLKGARFRYNTSFEEIDFTFDRELDKNQMLRLSSCQWIESHQDCILTGPTGAGKSFIASAYIDKIKPSLAEPSERITATPVWIKEAS